jgi:hypothetical protein
MLRRTMDTMVAALFFLHFKTMPLISLHDKTRIKAFTDLHPQLHLFERGDLDDLFWPYTTWYGWEEDGVTRQW